MICRDSDVLLLLCHLGHTEAEVWMVSGTSKQKKCYPVHTIASKLDNINFAKHFQNFINDTMI